MSFLWFLLPLFGKIIELVLVKVLLSGLRNSLKAPPPSDSSSAHPDIWVSPGPFEAYITAGENSIPSVDNRTWSTIDPTLHISILDKQYLLQLSL